MRAIKSQKADPRNGYIPRRRKETKREKIDQINLKALKEVARAFTPIPKTFEQAAGFAGLPLSVIESYGNVLIDAGVLIETKYSDKGTYYLFLSHLVRD